MKVKYLKDFARQLKLKAKYGVNVRHVSKENDTFVLKDKIGRIFHCRYVIVRYVTSMFCILGLYLDMLYLFYHSFAFHSCSNDQHGFISTIVFSYHCINVVICVFVDVLRSHQILLFFSNSFTSSSYTKVVVVVVSNLVVFKY